MEPRERIAIVEAGRGMRQARAVFQQPVEIAELRNRVSKMLNDIVGEDPVEPRADVAAAVDDEPAAALRTGLEAPHIMSVRPERIVGSTPRVAAPPIEKHAARRRVERPKGTRLVFDGIRLAVARVKQAIVERDEFVAEVEIFERTEDAIAVRALLALEPAAAEHAAIGKDVPFVPESGPAAHQAVERAIAQGDVINAIE